MLSHRSCTSSALNARRTPRTTSVQLPSPCSLMASKSCLSSSSDQVLLLLTASFRFDEPLLPVSLELVDGVNTGVGAPRRTPMDDSKDVSMLLGAFRFCLRIVALDMFS